MGANITGLTGLIATLLGIIITHFLGRRSRNLQESKHTAELQQINSQSQLNDAQAHLSEVEAVSSIINMWKESANEWKRTADEWKNTAQALKVQVEELTENVRVLNSELESHRKREPHSERPY